MDEVANKNIHVITLQAEVEKVLSDALVTTSQGTELSLVPQLAQQFFAELEKARSYCFSEGYKRTALLCDPRIRLYLRRLIEKKFPDLPVLSYAEIAPSFTVEVLHTISFSP